MEKNNSRRSKKLGKSWKELKQWNIKKLSTSSHMEAACFTAESQALDVVVLTVRYYLLHFMYLCVTNI